ncbi:ABC transporter ATP-binding protein [Anaerotignum sp. MSJ-24]|uniref:ABC transporter ATP-binding protein n=1 Tax=Anaerotignum sp. MSJ-24 TaxID=2841521 RepID=UPI001C0FC23A|nr:ABC transporter ATP-binding protein [Anaerotignum sp. MSJ-24]MBU5463591.1 ABC transporter ATP-binding protein/permease [Anaerotignum sp. MSJ-24]
MIKQLSKSIRQYKKDAILSPVFVTGEVILEVLVPTIMAMLIDNGINKGDMNYIIKVGIILIICCIGSLFCGIMSGKYAAKASAGFAANLRHDMYYKVQDYSFLNIDKFSTASIVTRLTTDITNVQMAFMMIIRIAVRSPVMLISAFFAVLKINSRIALIYLCAIPILGIGLYLIMTNAHPIFKRVFKKYDKLNAIVQENLYGIRVVKSYVREDHEIEKFDNSSQEIYDDFTKAEKLLAFNAPLMQFCVYACLLFASWLGAKYIIGGQMLTGNLVSITTYTFQILMSLMILSMVFVMITMAKTSAERITEILAEEPDIKDIDKPVTEVKNGSVKFEDVSFSYAKRMDKLCLSHVNLDIKSGETIGIIGGTGSSKSSLVQLIPRLYDVTEGSVKVGGVDVRNYDIEALRDEVAMVLQKNVLFSGTIKENLRWGNKDATDEELKHVCELACADEFIEQFPDKYDTYIEQGGSNVSGGQKQRLCIARALLKKPKILILDDSTSAVDTATDAKIRKAFREEIPETTKFIIAQRISSVEDADKVIIINNGKIEAFGTPDELMKTNDIYREIYISQTKGGEEE